MSLRRLKRSATWLAYLRISGLRRVALAPVPFLLQFVRERIGILHAFDVAARPGIAVPVPGAADIATLLIDPHREPLPAQFVQHVHAGKTGAGHDDVVGLGACGLAPWPTWIAGRTFELPRFLQAVIPAFYPGCECARAKNAGIPLQPSLPLWHDHLRCASVAERFENQAITSSIKSCRRE